jgi:group I intron endonuclease
MTCYLYRGTNTVTGATYIGVSINPPKRWKEHERDAQHRPQGRLHRAIAKYGASVFSWEIVRVCADANEAKLAELCHIYLEEPAYNLTAGGDGNWGYRHTPEAIERSAAARRGRPQPATAEFNRRTKRGVSQSAEHVEKRVSQIRGRKADRAAVERRRQSLLATYARKRAAQEVSP